MYSLGVRTPPLQSWRDSSLLLDGRCLHALLNGYARGSRLS